MPNANVASPKTRTQSLEIIKAYNAPGRVVFMLVGRAQGNGENPPNVGLIIAD